MEVEGVVFDLSNVLISDPFDRIMELKGKEFQNVLEKIQIKREEFIKAWREANKSVEYPFISHFYQEIPIIVHALNKIGIKENAEEIASHILPIYRDGLRIAIKNDKISNDVKDVLEFLKNKNKKLAVFSNERYNAVRAMIKWSEFEKYFDRIISGEEIGIEKNNLAAFRYVLNSLGTRVGSTAYVGTKRYVEQAKMTGMKVIVISKENEEFKGTYKPDFVISKISEIKNIIS
jgi:FMN phosphatase YigB (HAD superfamily)